jgi:hypothetical protein
MRRFAERRPPPASSSQKQKSGRYDHSQFEAPGPKLVALSGHSTKPGRIALITVPGPLQEVSLTRNHDHRHFAVTQPLYEGIAGYTAGLALSSVAWRRPQ